jgi:hypothetical protein
MRKKTCRWGYWREIAIPFRNHHQAHSGSSNSLEKQKPGPFAAERRLNDATLASGGAGPIQRYSVLMPPAIITTFPTTLVSDLYHNLWLLLSAVGFVSGSHSSGRQIVRGFGGTAAAGDLCHCRSVHG